MKQSDELTRFYAAYENWIDGGAEEDNRHGFQRESGLCRAIMRYCEAAQLGANEWPTVRRMQEEMRYQFEAAGLDGSYPFNYGDRVGYHVAVITKVHYCNEARIEWVRARA